jgi:iron complex outermembrane receptor protein
MTHYLRKTTLAACLISSGMIANAQNIEPIAAPKDSVDLYNLSLEDLMQITVVSASKKAESIMDAPSSVSVLSKEEIRKAGSTSIMEALRLMPGLIVRETTSGNYDIHLRGFDNVPPNSLFTNATNSITLVMIDNRPVYNYFNGGTFWETLPVDINDVEKIEVVRGPSSALYGPNAAAGVINIITRRIEKADAPMTVANIMADGSGTTHANASVGYRFGKLSAIVSGNVQDRNRHDDTYYEWKRDLRVDNPALIQNSRGVTAFSNVAVRYPERDLALRKKAANVFLNYDLNETSHVSVSAGAQSSIAQKVFGDNQSTPLTTAMSDTRYADVRAKVGHFSSQLSYLGGTQTPAAGVPGWKYDLETFDAVAEYDIVIKNLSIKPGLNFRQATYDDRDYWNTAARGGVLNKAQTLSTVAASLRADYKLNEQLRLVAALRGDKYNTPDKTLLSYQLAATYKLNEKMLIRAAHSRSNRGAFMVDSYMDFVVPTGPSRILFRGNEDLKLLTINMYELGYRWQAADNLQIDAEAFMQQSENYTDGVVLPTTIDVVGNANIRTTNSQFQNTNAKARQMGVTLSANYVAFNGKLQIKPFVTFQQTQIFDYSPYSRSRAKAVEDSKSSTSVDKDTTHNVSDYKEDLDHKGTPAVYGGMFVHYQITPQWSINLNPYYLGSQTFLHRNNTDATYKNGKAEIASKLLLNLRVAYKATDGLEFFFNARNLLNDDQMEYANTDRTKGTYMFGLNLDL